MKKHVSMRILVIGTPKRSLSNTGFNALVLGLNSTKADFDHYPNLLTQSDNLESAYVPKSSYGYINYPDYSLIMKNLKKRHYNLIITKVCLLNYSGGKYGFLSKLLRKLKYSFTRNKYKMGGTIVTDWIKNGIELPPVVVFDDTAEPFIWPVDFELLINSVLYFKKEVPYNKFFCFRLFYNRLSNEQQVVLANKIKPSWLSYDYNAINKLINIKEQPPYKNRDIDISNICYLYSNYTRIKLLPLLKPLENEYRLVTGKFEKKDYLERLKRTKIAISLPGLTWDCVRHYEIMLCGALLFVARPTLELAYKLKDGENCVFINNDLSNFEKLARYYLDNPELSAKIAQSGYELAKNELGCEKLAEYVMNTIKEHIGKDD